MKLQKLDKARGVLQRITGSIISSEREVHDALQNAVCRDKTTHDDISLGLLACILTDHGAAQRVRKYYACKEYKQFMHFAL